MDNLEIWNTLKRAIDAAHSVADLSKIRDKAEAYRYALKVAGESKEVVRKAEEIKLRAERRAGELLIDMPKQKAGDYKKSKGSQATTVSNYKTIGIDKRDASKWQRIASIPEKVFEHWIVSAPEISTAGALGVVRDLTKKINDGLMDLPTNKKYRIIYADPPWQYDGNQYGKSGVRYTQIDSHYPTMSLEELCSLPVCKLTGKDAVLFLWTTSAFLESALSVVNAWGFSYKTSMVWDKVKHTIGYYVSMRHELLLICGKGSSTPDVKKLYDSVYSEVRTSHSKKPEYFRNLIDELYPKGKRIELFARGMLPTGWEGWGNEVLANSKAEPKLKRNKIS